MLIQRMVHHFQQILPTFNIFWIKEKNSRDVLTKFGLTLVTATLR